MKISIPFTNKILKIEIDKVPQLTTLGIGNRTEDNYFVLFLDYDNTDIQVIKEDVDFLQKNFDVGTVIVSQSSEVKTTGGANVGNYHVIGFTKYIYPEIKQIIGLARADSMFRKCRGWEQREWVLRILDKKTWDNKKIKPIVKFKEIIPHTTKREASKAMIIFIEKLFGIELMKYFKKIDNTESIDIIDYATFIH